MLVIAYYKNEFQLVANEEKMNLKKNENFIQNDFFQFKNFD